MATHRSSWTENPWWPAADSDLNLPTFPRAAAPSLLSNQNTMTTLVPRDSFFQDLFDFCRDFDQIFNRIVLDNPIAKGFFPKATFGFVPAVEAYVDKKDKKYISGVSLPGSDFKDVQIHAQGNYLTIKGERRSTRTTKEVDMMNEEIVYGAFERVLTLPEGVVTDKLEAEYKDGVREITAPLAVAALPRKIEIKTVPLAKKAAA
jgi:HSP20 family protein